MCNGLGSGRRDKGNPCQRQEVMLDNDEARGGTAFRKKGHEEPSKGGRVLRHLGAGREEHTSETLDPKDSKQKQGNDNTDSQRRRGPTRAQGANSKRYEKTDNVEAIKKKADPRLEDGWLTST